MRGVLEQAEALARQARMLDRGRTDSIAAQRDMTRMLVIVLALSPYTRATDAAPGQRGRPIEPAPPRPVLPAQREPIETRTPMRRTPPPGTPGPPRRRRSR